MSTAALIVALLALIIAIAAYGKASKPYQIFVDVDADGISYARGDGTYSPDIEGPPVIH